MLDKSGESGHPCLVSDLRGKTSSFLLLNMILAVSFSDMAFIILRQFSSIPSLLKFLS